MFKSYFQEFQIIMLIGAGVCLLLSLLIFRKKHTLSLILLCLSGFLIFLFGATLDDYLNLWDERFHALVAKNLMENPFKPMLYSNPILDIEYDYWALAHVWMHKQPLFLWQSAMSFKIFGLSELSFRLPSVFLASIMIITIYRSSRIITNSYYSAYISSLLFMSSFFFFELITGNQGLDQNDVSFTAYISFSIWSWIEYQNSKNKLWLIGIGLFSGCAVLTKWLVGLLVYLVWMFYLFLKKHGSQIKDFISSALLTLFIAFPWQLYCYLNYKEEYLKELNYSSEHLFNVIEGHSGSLFYYFDFFHVIYGFGTDAIFVLGIFLILKRRVKLELVKPLLFATLFVYLFFTVAQTKMEGYTVINMLFVVLIIGYTIGSFIEYCEEKLMWEKAKKMLFPLGVIVLMVFRFDIEKIQEKHTAWKGGTYIHRMQTANKQLLQELTLQENDVLFNVKGHNYIESMFYTDNVAYSFIPSQRRLEELNRKGYKAIIIRNKVENFDAYIEESPSVKILEKSFY